MENHYQLFRLGHGWWPQDEPDYFKKLVWQMAWVLVGIAVIAWYVSVFAEGGGL